MKLYFAPGACSIGIHVLMNEIGKPFEAHKMNFMEREQYGDAFVKKNPKSKVPTLEKDDGSVITEFPAIATYLAMSNPDKKLLPANADDMAKALEVMDYCVATIHMQGFSRMFRPENYAPSKTDHDAVKARGKEIFEKGLALLNEKMAGKDYVLGGQFSIADAALFYIEFWAGRVKIDLPANLQAHFNRMKARPAVQRTFAAEGLPA